MYLWNSTCKRKCTLPDVVHACVGVAFKVKALFTQPHALKPHASAVCFNFKQDIKKHYEIFVLHITLSYCLL